MAAPVSPFCLSSDVAPFHAMTINHASDFRDGTDKTTPSKTVVDGFILKVSAMMLMRFRLAGYVTPLAEPTGETWPTDQTTYLNMVAVMGASAFMSGVSVSNPGIRGAVVNPFKQAFDDSLDTIYTTKDRVAGPFFGASYRVKTAAERAVITPAIPTTSFLLELYDPASNVGFQRWTDVSQAMQDWMEKQTPLLHNYNYELNSLNKGPYL